MAIAVTVAVTSNVAQRFVTRLGPRRVLAVGLLLSAVAEGLLTRLPVHGHYVTDLLPSLVLIGAGIGISFVSVTIAALAGVPGRDAGIASGLVNTARQVGGAVGLAGVTTIATIYASHHSATESSRQPPRMASGSPSGRSACSHSAPRSSRPPCAYGIPGTRRSRRRRTQRSQKRHEGSWPLVGREVDRDRLVLPALSPSC